MAKQSKINTNRKPTKGNLTAVTPKQKSNEKPTTKNKINFFDRNLNLFFTLSVIITILFSFLLFDVKISTGEDDAGYIIQAREFARGLKFPSWHGPFYPIFLSLPMSLFGLNLVVLKFFSLLFVIGHIVFLGLAFRRRINPFILVATLILTAVNYSILYFSSQTYSEALYMFLQALYVFWFIILLERLSQVHSKNWKQLWGIYLVIGGVIFLMSITRNIGLVTLISTLIFTLIYRNYYAAGGIVLSFYLFKIPFEFYKKIVWRTDSSGFISQFEEILYKNQYNKTLGTEDFSGMVTRFLENTKIYLSRHFFNSIGFRDLEKAETFLFPAIVLAIIAVAGLVLAFRRNKIMMFIGLYLVVSISATFVVIQQIWGQLRLIAIYIPLMLLFFSWVLMEISSFKKLIIVKYILFGLIGFSFLKTVSYTINKTYENQEVLIKNLEGNKFYGFTPDWVNFLRMSEFVGKKISEESIVASRKPSMSYIYARGREFYPVYRVPMEPGDSVLNSINRRFSEICIFDMGELHAKQVPGQFQGFIRTNALAFVGQGSNIYGVFNVDSDYREYVHEMLLQYQVKHTTRIDTFSNWLSANNEAPYAVLPDSLVAAFRRNNVEYAILASLRTNPNMKGEHVVNTMHRYLYFIELKYPNLFTVEHQIGRDNDEPAKLVKLHYDRYNL